MNMLKRAYTFTFQRRVFFRPMAPSTPRLRLPGLSIFFSPDIRAMFLWAQCFFSETIMEIKRHSSGAPINDFIRAVGKELVSVVIDKRHRKVCVYTHLQIYMYHMQWNGC